MIQKIKQFLQGKKTYFSAAVIALAAICGWWFGALDSTQAVALLGTAGVAAGLGAKSQRTADTILTVLADLRQVQAVSAAGQKVDPKKLAVDVAKELFAQVASANLPGIPVAAITDIPASPAKGETAK